MNRYDIWLTNAPESAPCRCGHDWDEHLTRSGEPCACDWCDCPAYDDEEPEPDPDRIYDERRERDRL